jgi:deoxyribodipyrimidine photolyase-related protein
MIESVDQSTRYPFQKRKLVLLFSAMRHFAAELRKRNLTVDYYSLLPDGSHRHSSFEDALQLHIQEHKPSELVMMELPDVGAQLDAVALAKKMGLPFRTTRNTNFLIDRQIFADEAHARERLSFEHHYRRQRQRFGVLMDGKKPVGGGWIVEEKNNATLPDTRNVPRPVSFLPDQTTREVIQSVDALFIDHPGSTKGFDLPVTHGQAIALVDDFIENRLRYFGTHRDAMAVGESLLFHSFFSPFLNIGLLTPLHLLKKIEHAYQRGQAPLTAVEPFIRQILGWREYLYGTYHAFMPVYLKSNYLDAHRKLPDFFWTGETDLRCLAESTSQALRSGYLHHAQRLTVVGNFVTLVGIQPMEVLNWFMTLFLDAFEWVAVPNVLGIGTFADGGLLTTTPPVSEGTSIQGSSNYCIGCRFSPSIKTGPNACPFNYLFWSFLDRNRAKLSGNAQMTALYRKFDQKTSSEKREVCDSTDEFLKNLS